MRKLIILLVLLTLTGCKSMDIFNLKEKNINNDTEIQETLEKLKTNYNYKEMLEIYNKINNGNVLIDGIVNPLTGLMMEKTFENKRPTAIVFNNLKVALPQSGISQSDIYYEVLAEGGITRLIGISHDFYGDKIGPIRSTRDYFIEFALDNDAIFVHHGGSPQGYAYIKNNNINNLDGMSLEGSVFYRDRDRARQRGLEHSSYTSGDNIKSGIENYNYNEEHATDFVPSFVFHEENYIINSEEVGVKEIRLPYSYQQISKFVYNKEEEVYERFQGDDKHIDEETDEQITVKNLIVQFATSKVIDDIGRMEVGLIGTGAGFYFTNGEYEPIQWRKDSALSPTKWYHEDGNQLLLNKGKTWISVFPSNQKLEVIQDKDNTD